MGKLPETLALLCLVLVVVVMAGQLAGATMSMDQWGRGSPFQDHWSLSFRRELAENPPALLRDLRIAGPARFAFLGLGGALAVVAARRTRGSGARAAQSIGLLALLLAVALAARIWAAQPTGWLRVPYTYEEPGYPSLAPALAALRLGLLVAIAGHGLSLLLRFAAARRGER